MSLLLRDSVISQPHLKGLKERAKSFHVENVAADAF